MQLTFLGATGTVTGSKYLVEHGSTRILVDCGLFQGLKALRLQNWAPPPFSPSSLDAVVLTHAHIDHSGYVPLLYKQGFRGTVYCTRMTRDLCRILLPDSGRLQDAGRGLCTRRLGGRPPGLQRRRRAPPRCVDVPTPAPVDG